MLLSQSFDITLGQAGVYALLGYAVVFFGLFLLMLVVSILGKSFSALEKQKAEKAAAPIQAVLPTPVKKAPGAAGELKLHNIEPKIAAMLMAIVADNLGKPINELRFISIKEVEQ